MQERTRFSWLSYAAAALLAFYAIPPGGGGGGFGPGGRG